MKPKRIKEKNLEIKKNLNLENAERKSSVFK